MALRKPLVIDSNGSPSEIENTDDLYPLTTKIPQYVSNNAGQIKLNWTDTTRPTTGQGMPTGSYAPLPLNQNYTVSGSPTTTYPFLADELIGGENLISPSTNYLRELKAGQNIMFRVKAGYINKAANQSGTILLRLFNPNPASTFEIVQEIPALSGLTSFEKELYFFAIADGVSLDPLYGYALEAQKLFNDNNFEVYVENITAFYLASDLFNKV